MKRTFFSSWMLLALVFLALPLHAFAEDEMPEWTYPLSPEIIQDNDQYLTLTNKIALLSSDYVPDDLVAITARCAVKGELREEANRALKALFDAAEADGYKLYVKSSYRSYQTQKTMYSNRLASVGHDDGYVAYPGSSDHQTGLGIDVLNYEWTKKSGLNATFIQTKEAQWMAAHCHEFGFVIRYMEDKEDVTGIKYEPWHLRYVGLEAAAYMTEMHFSLEEFTEDWQHYVAEWEAQGGNLTLLVRQRSMPLGIHVVGIDEDGDEEIFIYH